MHKNLILILGFLLLVLMLGCSFSASGEITTISMTEATGFAQMPAHPEMAGTLSGTPLAIQPAASPNAARRCKLLLPGLGWPNTRRMLP